MRPAQVRLALVPLCLVPLLLVAWRMPAGELDGVAIEQLRRSLGGWALVFLLVTLSVTPLRKLAGWHWLAPLRRVLGLSTFGYASLHAVSYLRLKHDLNWHAMAREIVEQPLIALGVAAFVLMMPLAATSSHAMVRALGGARWQRLHRGIYVIAVLALGHYWAMAETPAGPLGASAVLGVLLGVRWRWRAQERARQLSAAQPAARVANGDPPRR